MERTYSYQKDEGVYRRGDVATYFYQVVTGAVRTSSKLHDGRRQIGAFYFAGDIFGLEPDVRHRWSAEAIETTALRRVKRQAVLRKSQSNLSFSHGVFKIAERELLHAEDHRILLGQLTATERTAAFLLQMNHRIGVSGEIELRMRAQDAADYLGLTLETVSREIAKLSHMGILKRHNRSFQSTRVLTLRSAAKLRAMLPPSCTFEIPSISEAIVRTLFS